MYDAEGNVIQTETEISINKLPGTVISYIEENYPDAEIEEAEWIESQEGNFYEVEIEDGDDQEIELLFSENGNFIEEIIESDGDDDDDGEEGEEESEIEIGP